VSPGEELTVDLQLKNVGDVDLDHVTARVDASPAWVERSHASSQVTVPVWAGPGTDVPLRVLLKVSEQALVGAEGEVQLSVVDDRDGTWPVRLTLNVVPGSYALHPNFPNPFNPSTTLSFDLPAAGPVSLKVYNLRGQCVHTLAEGPMDAGAHRVVWPGVDGSGEALASGVYFCRLEAGGGTLTRKLLLVK
jgi:hypothetical protein